MEGVISMTLEKARAERKTFDQAEKLYTRLCTPSFDFPVTMASIESYNTEDNERCEQMWKHYEDRIRVVMNQRVKSFNDESVIAFERVYGALKRATEMLHEMRK